MSHGEAGNAVPADLTSAQPVRILMPSPIGQLGVELIGTKVAHLRIEPAEPERSAFTPLHRLDGAEAEILDEVFGRLSEYFAGARRKLDLEYDPGLHLTSSLARRILHETARIPYGKTRTYQVIAEAVGAPEGASQARAVLLENPLPIVIPCHRVVAGSHQIGDYIAGSERKQWLLELEQRGEDEI
jgi:methylated-DNA-[protein]-cysteine S-methyltransferase